VTVGLGIAPNLLTPGSLLVARSNRKTGDHFPDHAPKPGRSRA